MNELRRRVMGSVADDTGAAVDLGLSSGTLWASGNLIKNASGKYYIAEPTEFGAFFSWGNIDGHRVNGENDGYSFSSANYSSTTGAGLTDNITPGDATYDTARARLGGKWMMPTTNEVKELMEQCTWNWKASGNTDYNGVTGYEVVGRNGNSIFLPVTGYYVNNNLYIPSQIIYWSTGRSLSESSACMNRSETRQIISYSSNFWGMPIRPIIREIPYSVSVGQILGFSYTGDYKTMDLPAGTYKLECWGAKAGDMIKSVTSTLAGAKGGYSVGTITISKPTTICIYVGGKGDNWTYPNTGVANGGFNGGGKSNIVSTDDIATGGGGASDIRIRGTGTYVRVIVAGGAGGSGTNETTGNYGKVGGYGGGTSGGNGTGYTTSVHGGLGGGQTSGGTSYYGTTANSTTYGHLPTFGNGGYYKSSYRITGGGGGWYGGGYSRNAGAGGGSGFVLTSSTRSSCPSGYLLGSEYFLSNAETKAGNTSFPTITGSGTETGHNGNGYVKITRTA